MNISIPTKIAAIACVVLLAPPAPAHPGATDPDGCHYCRAMCPEYGVPSNKRHCHDEENRSAESPDSDSADDERSSASTGSRKVKVTRVLDAEAFAGTSVDDAKKVEVRLRGVDCPAPNPQCIEDENCIDPGTHAESRLKELVVGETVKLIEGTGEYKTSYDGKVLAYAHLPDDTDIGLELIKSGFCADAGPRYPHPRQNDYRAHGTTPTVGSGDVLIQENQLR